MINEEKKRNIERKIELKRRKKEFIREEKESLIRQKKEERLARKKHRRKYSILHSLKNYLREIRRRKAEKQRIIQDNKPIRKRINRDIRRNRIKKIKNFPQAMVLSFNQMGYRHRMRLQNVRDDFKRATSGYALIKESPGIRGELWRSYLNSVSAFLLGFVVLFLVCNLTSIVAAKFFDIPAVLYSYRIFWPLYTYSSLYSRQALIIIFGVGPLVSVILAILLFQLLKRILHFRLNLKVVLLWMIFHALNLFFGAYVIGVITRTGFIYTTEWLFFSNIFDVEEILFLIISIITLLIVGFYFTRYFLLTANSNLVISPKIRIFYLIAKVLLPWITGFVLLYFINYPNNPPELVLLLAVSLLMIIPPFFNYNSMQNKSVQLRIKEDREFVGWIYILIAALLLGFYRLVLFNGVGFG